MTRYLIDSWAWIEYLQGSSVGRRVKEEVENDSNEIFTHVVSLAEITSKVKRKGLDVEIPWSAVTMNSKISYVDESDAKKAGLLHAKTKSTIPNFSLGDAFVLAAARELDAKVLTGDPDFETIGGAVLLKTK